MREYVPLAIPNSLQLLVLLSACTEIFSLHNANKTDEEYLQSLDTCHSSVLIDDEDKRLRAV